MPPLDTRLSVQVADPGYGPSMTPDETARPSVRLDAEPVPWAPVDPPAPPAGELVFLDGVQQIEAWLTVCRDDDPRPLAGVAFAVAAGAVRAGHGGPAEICDTVVRRAVVTEGDRCLRMPDLGAYRWESRTHPTREPAAMAARVGQFRQELEHVLADRWAAPDRLLVVDGRLSFVRDLRGPVIGAVKSHHVMYLEGDAAAVVPALRVGQRTPLFAIGEDRYSWYQRLPGVGERGWAGILRGETPRSLGLDAARHLADRAAAQLPAYAGRAHRDPRAPQNTMPVMVLESRLRHRLGDRRLALRAVRAAASAARLDDARAVPRLAAVGGAAAA
jgi:hypothetical protein